MFSTDDDVPNISLTLGQLRQLLKLAEGVALDGEEERYTDVRIYPASGLRALDRAVIAKASSVGGGGGGNYDEALIDLDGKIRVGYEPDRPNGHAVTVNPPPARESGSPE